MTTSSIYARLPCIIATLLLLFHNRAGNFASAAKVTYGTENGFDQGGEEPICLISILYDVPPPSRSNGTEDRPDQSPSSNAPLVDSNELLGSVEEALFEEDNQGTSSPSRTTSGDSGSLFGGSPEPGTAVETMQSNAIQLLSECYNETNLQITGLDLLTDKEGSRSTIYRWQPYTFHVDMRMDTGDQFHGDDDQVQVQGLFVRFVLCNALDIGFCNAVTESPEAINSTATALSTDSTELLDGVLDDQQRVVFSSWAQPVVSIVEGGVVFVEPFDVQFQVPKDTPRALYRLIFHGVLIFDGNFGSGNATTTTTTVRLDASAEADDAIISVEDPPKILEMSKGIIILIFALIALYGLLCCWVLFQLFQFRKHPAVKLAQGSFLAAMTLSSFVGSTFTFTFMPEKDWYCSARGTLVLVPFTAIGAILVARLWRVYVTLSAAMKLGKSAKPSKTLASTRLSVIGTEIKRWNILEKIIDVLSWFAELPILPWLFKCFVKKDKGHTNERKISSLHRKTATAAETAQLIVFLVLPQVVLQVAGVFIYSPKLELRLNETEQVGRYFCDDEYDKIQIVGFLFVAVIYVFTVILAWAGRNLPSIFNEKDAIFNSASIAAVFVLIIVVVVETTDNESTSPDSSAFLRCISFIGIAALIVVNLVLPKLRRAMKNEKVVVGAMLRAYGNASSIYSSEGDSGAGKNSTAMTQRVHLSGAPIVVRKDDPIPSAIESEIHQLTALLRVVSDKSAYGNALSEDEWLRLQRNVAKLKTQLDRVTLEFSHSLPDQLEHGPEHNNSLSRNSEEGSGGSQGLGGTDEEQSSGPNAEHIECGS